MMRNKLQQNKDCELCKHPMIRVPHVEYDGDLGSLEPYWECTNSCDDNEGLTCP